MTWFTAFRGEFGYTYYSEFRTAVTWDIPYVAVIYSCVLISIAVLISAAGIRGKERWYTLLRMICSLLVGTIILLGIFGYCWQIGDTTVNSQYIYRSPEHVQGTLGIRIALRKVNVTLTGNFANSVDSLYYNEEVHLDEVGGPVVELHNCLHRGLPHPVLGVFEYLTADAGGLRWGRSYRLAGYYTNILLWTAFSFWLISNLIMGSVVFYGGFMFMMTGVSMVTAAVVYHVLQPEPIMRLICAQKGITLHYGWCFWAVLIVGILTSVIGLALLMLDYKIPQTMSEFFMLEDSVARTEEPESRKESSVDALQGKSNYHVNKGFLFDGRSLDTFNSGQAKVLNFPINKSGELPRRNTETSMDYYTQNTAVHPAKPKNFATAADFDDLYKNQDCLNSSLSNFSDLVIQISEILPYTAKKDSERHKDDTTKM
ncbi:hypothetical protein ScPMuIL_012659 [Solemya velum]